MSRSVLGILYSAGIVLGILGFSILIYILSAIFPIVGIIFSILIFIAIVIVLIGSFYFIFFKDWVDDEEK